MAASNIPKHRARTALSALGGGASPHADCEPGLNLDVPHDVVRCDEKYFSR